MLIKFNRDHNVNTLEEYMFLTDLCINTRNIVTVEKYSRDYNTQDIDCYEVGLKINSNYIAIFDGQYEKLPDTYEKRQEFFKPLYQKVDDLYNRILEALETGD